MSKRKILIVVAVVVALLAAAVPAGLAFQRQRERAAQRDAAEGFARAWRGGTLAQVTYSGDKADDVATGTQRITAALTSAERDVPAAVEVESVDTEGDAVTARLTVDWSLSGGTSWRYETTLPIREQDGEWRPDWRPQVVHPKLADNQVLVASREQAPRADITGANGEVLVTERPVVVVGLEPQRATDVEASARAVAAVVDVDPDALAQRAKKAAPASFVEVITLRREAYDAIRARLQPIPGAVFREDERALAPTAQFARALLGTVGSATAEIVEESDGRVRAGDLTGISGLQRTYDAQLAGTPGFAVRAVTASGTGTGEAGAGAAQPAETTLFNVAPKAGTPVRLTLDRRLQEAAEAALGRAPKPAALVAVRAGTGEVLAVANGGPNAAGYNRALLGQYPPGSTFKIVSTLALLEGGLSPDAPTPCPATLQVSGKTFSNAEEEVLGTVPFRTDFAHSCNTAFVGSAERISGQQLVKAASSLGFGQPDTTGAGAYTGSVPDSDEPVAHAAAVIGQGKVLASPLAVAGTSAAVAAGRWAPPKLVVEPAPKATAQPVQLPEGPVGNLRQMMRDVVTEGTATVMNSTPGGPVSGKTGTAEFGSGNPPPTHAWFTGYQGDVAFAVVVEEGGFGAEAAAPIAKDFLTRLAQAR